jgi:hypothetical protein
LYENAGDVEFGTADKASMKNTPHVPLRQITEE